jgi:hypothetical protein
VITCIQPGAKKQQQQQPQQAKGGKKKGGRAAVEVRACVRACVCVWKGFVRVCDPHLFCTALLVAMSTTAFLLLLLHCYCGIVNYGFSCGIDNFC